MIIFALALLLGITACTISGTQEPASEDSSSVETVSSNDEQEPLIINNGEMAEIYFNRQSPLITIPVQIKMAYPSDTLDYLERVSGSNINEWPEMKYLGETVDIGEEVENQISVTPIEIRIIPGSNVPLTYSPVLDITRTEPQTAPRNWGGLRGKPIVFIPPNSSLVMIRIETNPSIGSWVGQDEYPGTTTGAFFECPDTGVRFDYSSSKYRLSYPTLGESEVKLDVDGYYWLGEYQPLGFGCPASGWLYFYMPSMELNPGELWLEYLGGASKNELAFWTMTDRP
jgi:hypothetical protein